MATAITAFTKDGEPANYNVTSPDECPICHRNIAPSVVGAIKRKFGTSYAEVAFRCTSEKCDRIFIGIYELVDNKLNLLKTTPTEPVIKEFEDAVSKLSPSFVKIYNQALAAEAYGLDQIVGIGLRKALEFVIKDFAINQNPAKELEVKRMPLSQVIESFIKDENLKQVAQRAVWLGNDETHYERVWDEKDLNDLKRLIRLSVDWIDIVLTTNAYISAMPKSEKK